MSSPGYSSPRPVTDQSAHEPDLAILSSGSVWVVFSERRRNGDRIRLKKVHPDDSLVADVSETAGVEMQPTILAQPDDILRIVWVAFRDSAWHLLERCLIGGSLRAERILSSSSEGLFHPRLAFDREGCCWLANEEVRDQNPVVLVRRLQADGVWSTPSTVSDQAFPSYRPSLSAGPHGGMWVAYDAYTEERYRVLLSRVDAPGETVEVCNNGYQNLQASVACDNEHNLWIAWATNRNPRRQDPWWMTKWVSLRYFDGKSFFDPVGSQPGRDVSNEDFLQGWEFPEVHVDLTGRVWIFGQSSHTLYGQSYGKDGWSELITLAPPRWGSWKPRVRVAESDAIHVVSMGLDGAQIQRVQVHADLNGKPLVSATGNSAAATVSELPAFVRPVVSVSEHERLNVYFGDLHAHSVYGDAVGDVDEFYHRYRDAYGYDFATLTEHDYLDGIELSQSELKLIWNHAERMTVPGEFVALYGYEWTSPALADHAGEGASVGEGHRHILYTDQKGPLVSYGEATAKTGKQLLNRLQGTRALVIPHHTAWSGTDLDAQDSELQRLIEICSTHGRFEYPGNQPIGHRRDHIHPGKYVVDALARGYRLGLVGGSDSHGLRWHATEMEGRASHIPPGTRVGWKEDAYRTGMTVILASELTREALFEALYHRRCYATSGVRIFVDFRINGHLMGSDIEIDGQPRISASVRGTAPLRSVEVIRDGYVLHNIHFDHARSTFEEPVTSTTIETLDALLTPGEAAYYYLRVTQWDDNMAWSSPVWVKAKG